MIILAIDDEPAALKLLEKSIRQAKPDADIITFSDPQAAHDFMIDNKCDIVFTDISMRGITGLELARQFKKINPRVNIIFVTGYSEYMGDAFHLHVSGFITKPVTAERVEEELSNLLHPLDYTAFGVYAKTFGHFDLFVGGKAVPFEREKAKELLALLIDRDGAALTTEQMGTILFEDKPYDRNVKNQITTLTSSLQRSLKAVGAEDILIKTWGHLQIDKQKIRCDLYDYQLGEPYAINAYVGEYLANYSWGEERNAELFWKNSEL